MIQRQSAEDIIHRSSRSFSIASRFLPVATRSKVWALYAWCRSLDDAVDLATSPSQAKENLQRFEDDLIGAHDREPTQQPASEWILPLVLDRQINSRHALELIEGMRMDLEGYEVQTDDDLEKYCYHAAGTVGLMMTSLMGVKEKAADRHAIALGVAMQLTNIARDVKEDAQMGRSYLPGITKPLEAKADDIAQAVRKILDHAETRYNLAIDGMDYLPWRSRTAIRVALEVYREIGRKIQRNGYCVMTGRTVLSKPRLIWVASRAVLFDMLSIVSLVVRRLLHPGLFSLKEPNMTNSSNPSTSDLSTSNLSDPHPRSTPNQAKQIAFLGLSLTSIMATALFVMVYFNPKSQEYSYLPLIYAVGSLLASVLFHRLSARYDKPSPQAT